MDTLVRAPAARVITVASGSHSSTNADGGWVCRREGYDRKESFARSKLANIMFAYELARRLRDTRVTSNAVDPGGIASRFARNNGLKSWLRHLAAHAVRRDLSSPRRAAKAIVYLATSDALTGVTGRYFHRIRVAESSPASHDREAASQLWDLSVRLAGLPQDPTVRLRAWAS